LTLEGKKPAEVMEVDIDGIVSFVDAQLQSWNEKQQPPPNMSPLETTAYALLAEVVRQRYLLFKTAAGIKTVKKIPFGADPLRACMGKIRVSKKVGAGVFGSIYRIPGGNVVKMAVAVSGVMYAGDAPSVTVDKEFEFLKRAHDIGISPKPIDRFVCTSQDGRVFSFILMEYVPGLTLESLVKKHQVKNPKFVEELLEKVSKAISKLNSVGVFHNDLNPGNVIFNPQKGVQIIDFGFASDTPPDMSFLRFNVRQMIPGVRTRLYQDQQLLDALTRHIAINAVKVGMFKFGRSTKPSTVAQRRPVLPTWVTWAVGKWRAPRRGKSGH
jgi:predicted Ser/Thr protein kinase